MPIIYTWNLTVVNIKYNVCSTIVYKNYNQEGGNLMFDGLFIDTDSFAEAEESASYEGAYFEGEDDIIGGELDSATESAFFLDMMADTCDSLDEYVSLVTENAVTWELYGLIDDASAAVEATKKVTYDNWKDTQMKRRIGKEVMRLAAANMPDKYKKYRMFREKALAFRNEFYSRYGTKATQLARTAMRNTGAKAANMNSTHGNKIVQASKAEDKRIAAAYNKSSAGKNPTGTAVKRK